MFIKKKNKQKTGQVEFCPDK